MVSQWLIVVYSLIFVGAAPTTRAEQSFIDIYQCAGHSKVMRADLDYGWQASGNADAVYDVAIK
jgi:hypothetical protein